MPETRDTVLILLVIVLAAATALSIFMLWVRTRRRHVRFGIHGPLSVQSLARSMAGLTWGHLIEGNSVEIIQNSAFFDALVRDMAEARETIHLETFLWENGEVSERVTSALERCARDGIEVRVLVDQRGAMKTTSDTWARLRAAGADFRVYHRTRFRELAWVNNRDHRKIAVIDGCIGYTFGHGMADMWGGTPEQPAGWRDTAARFRGPVVNALQGAFLENWTKVTHEAVVGDRYFPPLEHAGPTMLHLAYVSPRETESAVKRLYFLAIAAAQREVILQNPYFIPDDQAIELCRSALARGVAISIMLPTAGTSDFPVVQHASHDHYGALLEAGARIYEFTRCGLHQKVMIVDGEWCSLGSTNFDPRSFNINDEITVGIVDRDVARQLREAFLDDVRYAREWTLEMWNGRSAKHRLVDSLSALVKRQL